VYILRVCINLLGVELHITKLKHILRLLINMVQVTKWVSPRPLEVVEMEPEVVAQFIRQISVYKDPDEVIVFKLCSGTKGSNGYIESWYKLPALPQHYEHEGTDKGDEILMRYAIDNMPERLDIR
jgi:hypothetical protein